MQLCFGACQLDPESRRLFRDGRELHLTPKAFGLLKVLMDSRPKALSKAELLERVWPDTFVCDVSLPRIITEIREALGDNPRHPRYIRTVHGFGYAFAVAVAQMPSSLEARAFPVGHSWLLMGSREFRLGDGETLIGRDSAAIVRLESPRVSRQHALITVSGDAVIEDLGSRNGTYLRGQRLTAQAQLEHGDQIEIGPYRLTFATSQGSGKTVTDVLDPGSPSTARSQAVLGPEKSRGTGVSR